MFMQLTVCPKHSMYVQWHALCSQWICQQTQTQALTLCVSNKNLVICTSLMSNASSWLIYHTTHAGEPQSSQHCDSAEGGGGPVILPALDAAPGLNAAVLGNLAPPAKASSDNEFGSMRTLAQQAAAAAAADASTQVSALF